jgi:uncharacterized protein YciI
MLYMILAHDKPDSLTVRTENRPAHLEYLKDAGDRLKLAGPILSPGDDPQPVGSMIVIDAASEMAVRLFAENDPYATAGLFANVEIKPWKGVVGAWVPEG